MPKYRISMTKDGSTDTVVIYAEKANIKVAYDDARAGVMLLFGPPGTDKYHVISVVELEV